MTNSLGRAASAARAVSAESSVSLPPVEELALSGAALLAAGISPNLFWLAQGGYFKLSTAATWVLLPAVAVLIAVLSIASVRHHDRLVNRVLAGAMAGALATIGLEIVRSSGFQFGLMPGSLPQLMGVLLRDQFMLGPSITSDLAGWSYHYWNGVCFGVIFTVLVGRKPLWIALGYGVLMALGFLASPAVSALGVGFMGQDMPGMMITVLLAHLVFGALLWWLTQRWVRSPEWILGRGID